MQTHRKSEKAKRREALEEEQQTAKVSLKCMELDLTKSRSIDCFKKPPASG